MVCKKMFLLNGLILASLAIMWYVSKQPCESLYPMQRAKTHILILTSWRSGSSFVGQLFNQNPHVFYLMEPTRHVWASMPNQTSRSLHQPVRDLLRSIYLCDILSFQPYISRYKYVTELFMWCASRALCSPPACDAFKRSDIIDRTKCFLKCGKISFEKMGDTCKTYSHIVVKSVRILDLKALYPLLKDPFLNLKIIHLVRDPRAVLFSREQFRSLYWDDKILTGLKNKSPDVFQVMQEICRAQVRIYKSSMQESLDFLKGRYMMARFEDLVKDPVGHIKNWYRYVGLNASPKLESWIYNITHGRMSNDNNFLPFSGNSEKIAQKWRTNLNFTKVSKLQEICKQEMNLFGYKMINSEMELKNMSLQVVLPEGVNSKFSKEWVNTFWSN